MKRAHSDPAFQVDQNDTSKAIKLDGADVPEKSDLDHTMKDFEEVQTELRKLDVECAQEQMAIQKKFDQKKKPWFDKRQKIIRKIPEFWCKTLQQHPALSYISSAEIEILKFLNDVDLEDNIDDSGSYKISFTFDEGAKEFFEPLTLVKHVKFDMDREYVEECTDIKWKPGKNPTEKIMENQSISQLSETWSIFEWFNKNIDDSHTGESIDIGEVIRRDIWHDPLSHYLGTNGPELEAGEYEQFEGYFEEFAEDGEEGENGDEGESDDN